MKQNRYIMVATNTIKGISEIYKALNSGKTNVILCDNIEETQAGLAKYSPAFLLLDYDIEGMDFLLSEIICGFYDSYPYIIAVASFPDGVARATVLRKGADVCIEKPIYVDEVLAIVEAVVRRGQWNMKYRQNIRRSYRVPLLLPESFRFCSLQLHFILCYD